MASYWDPIRKMLGCPDDVAAAGDGTIIAILKYIRSQLVAPIVVSGAVTIADGDDVAEGATDDAAVIMDADGTVSGKLRGLVKWAFERMPASLGQKLMAFSLPVVLPSDQIVPVSGTFWQTTQPVSVADGDDEAEGATTDAAASSTVAEDATVRTGIGLWKGIKNILILMNAKWAALGQAAMVASMPVVIANDQANVPVSVASTVAPVAKAGAAGNVHEPAANTAAVVTLAAAGGGVSNVLGLVAWSYDVLPTAGSLTIEDGAGSTIFKADVPESGPGFFPFNPGLKGAANTALIITLAAGSAGVSGIVSVHAWTE